MVKKIDANRITFESIKNWVKERSPWADLNIDFIDIGTIDRAFVNQISGIKTGVTTTVTKENVYAIPSNLTLHEDEKAGSPVHFDAEPLISCTVGYLDGNGHAVEFDEIDLNPLFSWAKDECDDGYRKEAITVFVQYIMLVSGCVASIWVTSKGTFFDTLDWAIGSVRICKEDILSGAALWSKPKGTLCSVIAHG